MNKKWNLRLARWKKLPAHLPLTCYLLTLAGWLLWGLFCLGGDRLGAATGTLAETALDPAACTLSGLILQEDGTLLTTDNDPQMIFSAQGTVRSLYVDADYTKDAREMCLYYTTRPEEPFSQDKRVFPVQADDGSCTYTLPRTHLEQLRLDPCSPAENQVMTITFRKLSLNRPRSAAGYFLPGWYGLFCLVLYPGLAAAALNLLSRAVGLFAQYKAYRKDKK